VSVVARALRHNARVRCTEANVAHRSSFVRRRCSAAERTGKSEGQVQSRGADTITNVSFLRLRPHQSNARRQQVAAAMDRTAWAAAAGLVVEFAGCVVAPPVVTVVLVLVVVVLAVVEPAHGSALGCVHLGLIKLLALLTNVSATPM
jgi:hypothetical protein